MEKKQEAEVIEIRKYPNRRLYDTSQSRYVTLADVAQMIRDGKELRVVDAKTRDDLTKAIMLQIISENKLEQEAIPIDFLRRIIGAGNRSVRQSIREYLSMGINVQQELQRQVGRLLRLGLMLNPLVTPWLAQEDATASHKPDDWHWPEQGIFSALSSDPQQQNTAQKPQPSLKQYSLAEERGAILADTTQAYTSASKNEPLATQSVAPDATAPTVPHEVEQELAQLRQQLAVMQQTIERLSLPSTKNNKNA